MSKDWKMVRFLKKKLKPFMNIHRPAGDGDIFLFTSPRSGSTWLMEMILTQPGFKPCNEPFDIRVPHIRQALNRYGLLRWEDYYNNGSDTHIRDYITAFCRGRLHVGTPGLQEYYYRLITRRIVFKILHAGEDRMEWFARTFNGTVVFLIRHPIAVAISRKLLPRLDVFMNTEYFDHFTNDQKQYARRLRKKGDWYELGMLDWSLQNAVPMKKLDPNWIFLTYEQLVLDPVPALEYLTKMARLHHPERMLNNIERPSGTTNLSDEKTKKVLKFGTTDKKNWLVQKWKESIDKELEARLMEIPARMGVDVYRYGDHLPQKDYWMNN